MNFENRREEVTEEVTEKAIAVVPKGAWQKGMASPNPKGRPRRDQSILDKIRGKLGRNCPYTDMICDRVKDKKMTWLEALAEADMIASPRDTTARKNLLDRLMGKAPDNIELSGVGGAPIEFTVVYDR